MKKAQPWIGLLARLGLGGVLLYAGYLKAFSPEKSMMAVRAYELLPIWLANIFGIVLPWLEIGAGVRLHRRNNRNLWTTRAPMLERWR